MKIAKDKVICFLPHRDPFLFIDSVEEIKRGETVYSLDQGTVPMKELCDSQIHAKFFVSPQMLILSGHFPGRPVLPGVIQIEMMAQASCFSLVQIFKNPFNHPFEVALVSAQNAKFRKPILPGMELNIYSDCKKVRGNMMSYDCRIENAGQIMSEASILAVSSF